MFKKGCLVSAKIGLIQMLHRKTWYGEEKKSEEKKIYNNTSKTTACSIKKTCIEGGQLIFPIKNSFIPQRTKYLIFPDKDIKALIHTYMYQPTYFPIYTKYNFKFAIDMFPTAAFSFSGEGVRHLNLL